MDQPIRIHLFYIFVSIVFHLPSLGSAQSHDESDAPIYYMTTEVNDPVANLIRQLESGEVELSYDDRQGYLLSVLEALDVPVSSQTLVFSKTSMQRTRISPRRPRAVYFNDDVYIGYCQNGEILELAATDAKQGAIFYKLKQTRAENPLFLRDQGHCLTCHSSNRTQDVPGYLVRSVYANATGIPEFGHGTYTTDHTSPFKERWGGWYVTGTHGDMRHMGNSVFNKYESDDVDRQSHANLTSLADLVSTDPYPAPHSDIVALMVLEHQTQMHNAITWANYETRRAIHQSQTMNEILDRPDDFRSDSCERRINRAVDRVLEHLLMCDEFRLTSPVQGTSSFASDFEARGIRDSLGRSLRDFDLKSRIFRYPCSYLVYSKAFNGLPDIVRDRILRKLHLILDGELDAEQAARFAHLTVSDRQNIKQILAETKPEFRFIEIRPASE